MSRHAARSTPLQPSSEETQSTAKPEVLADLDQTIRDRAYELYEQRGRQDGFAEQDWLKAETEVKAAGIAQRAAA